MRGKGAKIKLGRLMVSGAGARTTFYKDTNCVVWRVTWWNGDTESAVLLEPRWVVNLAPDNGSARNDI